MASKLPNASLSLKEFMLRKEVLQLYRNILRTIKQVSSQQDREYLHDWVKSDFNNNKHIKDELMIKSLIIHGENSMNELKKNINLSK
ncbi:hypothetical protein HCN44_000466 [Aphidius gifuensis]|uniref:LYR motif-containing protein 2 n=1 Tax=Aphidius gifuensis TaxID=684658 RepID=A0A834XTS7_APHGI|nr:hypothetical protein HCN44_000466 [Aphidius gifuensis]